MVIKIQNYIERYKMIKEGDRIVLGVSGGADSICLFHVLLDLIPIYHIKLFVVHVNHGIRGEDADKDELFVRELCLAYNVDFHSIKINIKEISAKDGITEEEAGRNIRYKEFYSCYKKNRCNKIAIAHNKNDDAETILFNLFRGSGIKGLTGIPPTRDTIIRPLLGVERREIEDFLKQRKIEYRIDYTNQLDDYTRNRIRNHVLTYAKESINEQVINHIIGAGNQLKEINDYVEKNVIMAYDRIVKYDSNTETYLFYIVDMNQEDIVIQRGIIRRIFLQITNKLKDIEYYHVNLIIKLMDKQVGKILDMPYKIRVTKGYDYITMSKKIDIKTEKTYKSIEINTISNEPISYFLPELNKWITIKLMENKKNLIIPQNGCTKWFDYDKIKNTVLIRTRNEGDYIQIDSKGSKKKLKSLFIDEKVPRESRDDLLLIADGSHIMWVIGSRMSEGYKVSEDTKEILEISLDGGNKNGRQ